MKRLLLNFLTLVCLLMVVVLAALWARSYQTSSVFGYHTGRGSDGWYRNVYCVSYRGRLILVTLRDLMHNDRFELGRFHARDDPDPSYARNPEIAGFGYRRILGGSMQWTEVQVPHWSLLLVGGIAPSCAVVKAIRRRRQFHAGLCPRCGYDLRATPDRCPECGTVALAETAT